VDVVMDEEGEGARARANRRAILSRNSAQFSDGLSTTTAYQPNEFEHVREYLPAVFRPQQLPLEELVDIIAAAFAKATELYSATAAGGGGGVTVECKVITTGERKQILSDRKEAERLEKERIEREAAAEALTAAVEAAEASRDAVPLAKPIARAKKAVDLDPTLLAKAEKLKTDLEEEKRAKELAERLEREKVEREGATEELTAAIEAAESSRDFSGLAKPIKRAKKAVDVDAALIEKGEKLKADLEEEKRENDRLERERIEREGATQELTAAVAAAALENHASTSAALSAPIKSLGKPIKRAKAAVEVDPSLIEKGEKLKADLEEEKGKRETAERLEREKIEREGATDELTAAIAAAESSRDAKALANPIKRAKKAVEVDAALIEKGEKLKGELEEEKKEKDRKEAEAKKAAAEAAKAEAAAAKAAAAAEKAAAASAAAE